MRGSTGALNDELREALPRAVASMRGYARRLPAKGVMVTAEDLAQDAVLAMLEGERTWDPSRVELWWFIREAMRSLASSKKKTVAKETVAKETVAKETVAKDLEKEILEAEAGEVLFAEMAEAARGDRDLLDLVAVAKAGAFKRRDVAEDLGWGVDLVTAARIKLQRRMIRKDRSFARHVPPR